MSQFTVFTTPSTNRKLRDPGKQTIKRKRGRTDSQLLTSELDDNEDIATISLDSLPVEYTATIAPEERSQRRLAGLSLDGSTPKAPFPHAPLPGSHDIVLDRPSGPVPNFKGDEAQGRDLSLRDQHLGVMIAILHRSMMHQDYQRARRALGLILRCELGGQPVDIRNAALWGMGAEILLWSAPTRSSTSVTPVPVPGRVTRDGFEQAKLYYERLIVQHPPHKTWPNAINAIDFLIAMFGLWIYVIHRESLQFSESHEDRETETDASSSATSYEKITWELNQAKEVAEAMDNRMNNVVYRDQPELLRLRGMVALWIADLLESGYEHEQAESLDQDLENELTDLDHVERIYAQPRPGRDSATLQAEVHASRELAGGLFNRFRRMH